MVALTRAIVDAEHYVTRYVHGRLSATELEAFEEFCLLHPDVAEEVATDRVLLRGLRALDAPAARRPAPRWMQYALAAGIGTITVAIGISGYRLFRADGQTNALHATADTLPVESARLLAGPFRVLRLRGSSVQALEIAPEARALLFNVEPNATSGSAAWRAVLFEDTGDRWIERGEIGQLSASALDDGALALAVDLAPLASSRLRITLEGTNGNVDEFEIRVVRTQ